MKQTYLKSLFLSLLMIVVGINVASAQTRTLWQEDFSSYSANDVPSGGTYNYVCKDGGSTTKIYNDALAGRTAPELLVSKSGGTFMATVPLDNIEGDLTLTFYTNKQTISVNTTTEGIEGSLSVKAEGQHTLTFTGVTADMTEIVIVFTGSGSSNVRLDDILLTYTPPSNRTLSSISLSGTYPTTFKVGDTFSHEGMTVTATYDDNTTEDVTEDASFEGYDMSTAGDQEVTVSYTEGEETKTATYDITVKNIQLTGITLSGDYPTTFDVGDTFSHEGMTVTANYDDETTEDVTSSATFEGYDMSTAGEQEVTVSYTKGEVTKAATYNITVKALTGDAYTLVTSVADLADGDNIIIVNKNAGKAMGGQNSNNRAATAVTFDTDGNAIVPSSTDIQVFTLEGDANGWYFNTGSGYIYAASSSSNHLKTETEADDNAKASISISDGDATIQFQGSNTRNLLKYNSGSSLFACYSSGQSPVQIYRKPVNKTLTGIMLSGEYPTTFFVGDEFSFGETGTVTAVYDDNSTKVVTELATFSGYDMNTAGNQTVTVSYTERGVTKEQTYEITVNNRALTSITLSGDYPTTFNVGDTFSHEGMTVTATYDDNTSENVTADATFEGYDMSTAGTQTVTVSYTKADVTKTATYEITVNDVAVTGITLNKEAVQLKVGKTTKLTATVEPDNATDKTVVWSSGDETVATVSEDGTVTAVAEGTATITAGTPDGAQTATCTVTVIAATAATEYYEKVTSAPEDWSGEYLIVYETAKVAFDGSLETLDAANNTIEVEFEEGKIPAYDEVKAAAFTIAKMNEGYSIKAASGKYIGATKYENKLISSESEIANSLSLDASGDAVITVTTSGGDVTLRYNKADDQSRFRYYKNGQQAIQLYKKVEATSVTTYSLVVGEEETPFESLSLTQELPAHTKFYIKDNKDNEYHSADAQSELIIIAENHENLPTSADGKDFYLKKANTWVFTLTEASDGLMLTVSPETEGETKYMLSGYLQESNDVFDENLKLTKEMTSTTKEFYFTRSDDYGLTNLTPATFNAPEDRRYWIFSEDDPTVEFIAGEIRGSYTVGEAGTYTFTIDLTNNTISVEKIPTTYTLVTVDETLTEYPFSGLTLTQELPAHTQFYIKDNMGNEYHSADAQSELIIIAENHENLPTSADGKDFYLKKANTWVFTLTEASDGLMLTVSPETEGETKYMLSGYLQESNDVFDENLKLTKEMTSTTKEFYFTRSDDYGLTNLTPATFNAPEDRRYWIFSEDDPTVEFIAGEIRGSYTVGEAGTYTFTIDLTNNTVTAEKTVEYVDLTISSYEWATFVTPSAVQFPDDVTAYIITEITDGNAVGEQITEAPAGTPVIVNGAEGIHKLLNIGKANEILNNELQVSDGTVTGDGTIYVLAVEDGQAGFAPLSNGKTLSDGKAYLKVENASGAKINFVIDGEATDIRNIENAVDFSDGDWYNLQGVKVTNPQRGIYIHNGKKVVIK